MKSNGFSGLYFVERLTFVSWLVSIFPFLARDRRDNKRVLFYIDGSLIGVFIAHLTARFLGISAEQLQFCYEDIRDEKGNLLGLRLRYKDFFRVQQWIVDSSCFQEVLNDRSIEGRLLVYLKKQIAVFAYTARLTTLRGLFLVHIAKWKRFIEKIKEGECVFFMDRRAWMNETNRYAVEEGVKVIPVRNLRLKRKALFEQFFRPDVSFFVKHIYFQILAKGWLKTLKHYVSRGRSAGASGVNGVIETASNPANHPRIGVDYYGHHNLDHPELHSDMFFWQQSALSGDDIVVMFKLPNDPVDKKKAMELESHNMHAVALSPKASVVSSVPVFLHWPRLSKKPVLDTEARTGYPVREKKWLQKQILRYRAEYNYWADLFERNHIKVYLSWFKYSAQHCVIADAMQSIGGITAIYQRAFEELPASASTIASDIVFGFSPWNAEIERKSGSIIPYHVSVGYFGDHRFELLSKQAQEIRSRLRKHGAKHIIAFFDENSVADSRWLSGHEFVRKNYEFLLEKVLSEPWLGVVFKPKTPRTLRDRLGPISDLLKRAEETGRCFVFERGILQGSYPPCIAALAADVAIGGHLYAATAGIEAALAGVPTLLLDREGWQLSSLYGLGKDKVVFSDWDSLWKAFHDYRYSKARNNVIGDWSPLLDKIDPFRDGRAAERIGTYLKWLLDGLKGGLSRDTVMADAAERYAQQWGDDKITSVNGQSGSRQSLSE
jgi:hypothetical protein